MKIGLTEVLLIGGGLWLWSRSKAQPSEPTVPPNQVLPEHGEHAIPAAALPAVRAAIGDAKQRLDAIGSSRIPGVISVQEMVWPNSSLGLPEPGRIYAPVITPGYRILIGIVVPSGPSQTPTDRTLVYHADHYGRVVYAGG